MTYFNRLICSATIIVISLFIFVTQANALFDGNVKKAKEFMQAGMYPQALALLEKEINDNPTNAEAHFQLGICYINQSNYGSADERFASAVRLNPDYGYKIGTEYKKAGEYNLKRRRLSSVRPLYSKAIEYDPTLKKGIAQKLFQDGKQNNNDNLFSLAVSFDSSLNNNVADYYYSLSQRSQGENSLQVLSKALQYSDEYRRKYNEKKLEIGKLLLKDAKRLAKIPGKEKETEDYKKKAINYLSRDIVLAALPEYKIYDPGEYAFSLKAGEQTDHWITTPLGSHYLNLGSTDDKFKIIYDDGVTIDAWSATSLPNKGNNKFRLKAVTDQEIKMTITEIK